MSETRTLSVGLIGCGTMGGSHATQLVTLPEVRLAVACDLDITRAEAVATQAATKGQTVRVTTDVATVLADPTIDGVIVATPNFTHKDVVLAALATGKDVFCEKPMALTLADCDVMIARAHELGRKLMVGQVLRLITVFATVRRLVSEGTVGKPFAVRILRCARRGTDGPWAATWRSKRANTGGLLHEVNVHEFDFMRSIFGEVAEVTAMAANFTRPEYDYEDHVVVTVRFRNGGIGVLESSVATVMGATEGLVTGDRGSIFYDWARNHVSYRLVDGTEVEVPVERDAGRSVQSELSSFAKWVLHGEPPVVTSEDGRRAVQLAEAAYESIATGRTVPLH